MGAPLSLPTSSPSPDTPAPRKHGPQSSTGPSPSCSSLACSRPSTATPALSPRPGSAPSRPLVSEPCLGLTGTGLGGKLSAGLRAPHRAAQSTARLSHLPFQSLDSFRSVMKCPPRACPAQGVRLPESQEGDLAGTLQGGRHGHHPGADQRGGHAKRHQSWQDSGWGGLGVARPLPPPPAGLTWG